MAVDKMSVDEITVDEMACCPWQPRGTGKHYRGSRSLNVSKCGIFCFKFQNLKNIFLR
jgi:hypothetical protein